MTKLNQALAVIVGVKSRVESTVTKIYHQLQKPAPFGGISRTYRPKDEEGEQLPPESTRVQWRASGLLFEARAAWTRLYDLVATQDAANRIATGEVAVDGQVMLHNVPVTTLLFLEKQLTDVRSLVEKLPTLDASEEWKYNAAADCYATEPSETTRTKKILRNHVLTEATKEHPAQVTTYTEDVLAGYWSTIKFSGAMPAQERNAILARIEAVRDGVKQAREAANCIDVTDVEIGKTVFDYLFNGEHGAQAQT